MGGSGTASSTLTPGGEEPPGKGCCTLSMVMTVASPPALGPSSPGTPRDTNCGGLRRRESQAWLRMCPSMAWSAARSATARSVLQAPKGASDGPHAPRTHLVLLARRCISLQLLVIERSAGWSAAQRCAQTRAAPARLRYATAFACGIFLLAALHAALNGGPHSKAGICRVLLRLQPCLKGSYKCIDREASKSAI